MDASLQKEFEFEMTLYSLNKNIINTISDMGYIIKDRPGGLRQCLVKKSHKHLIIINYDFRRRIIESPEDMREIKMKEDPELLKKYEPKTFSTWLKENDMLPPDFNLPEYDEDNIRKEYDNTYKDPIKHVTDHEDDFTLFEICIINKANEALIIGCVLINGEIQFKYIHNQSKNGLEISNMSLSQRFDHINEDGTSWKLSEGNHGPRWMYLSESL
jgi:hypothetical protein